MIVTCSSPLEWTTRSILTRLLWLLIAVFLYKQTVCDIWGQLGSSFSTYNVESSYYVTISPTPPPLSSGGRKPPVEPLPACLPPATYFQALLDTYRYFKNKITIWHPAGVPKYLAILQFPCWATQFSPFVKLSDIPPLLKTLSDSILTLPCIAL